MQMHQAFAAVLDTVLEKIRAIQQQARSAPQQHPTAGVHPEYPRWPMIILRSPKGWTGPQQLDGKQVEGTWRSHQVPIKDMKTDEHVTALEDWMKSYQPDELFDEGGRLKPEIADLAPKGKRRMGANPHANGGELLVALDMPDLREYAVDVPTPGSVEAEATRALGEFLRDVMKLNLANRNFRVFGPDETESNRLDAIYTASPKQWMADFEEVDVDLGTEGRVLEVLSESMCQGWLEGYLLTGRNGVFSCYEAFINIVDSMFNQHAKWLKTAKTVPCRQP